jgi:uncharacterized protein DUF4255
MALRNLYRVTNTLINLLTQNITKNIDTSLEGQMIVTAIPPDKVENPSNMLTLHLYHVAEDPYYKNALGSGSDVPAVAKAPMALSLFYILTAHHELDPAFDAETQQKLMGYALKTFHDFPVITDRTRINGTDILDGDLRGKDNSLQVILRPVSAEDALAFWNSEQTRTARLSAYYEVRVVMLEPEEPKTMPGIVLNLGAFLVQLGSPHFDSSQNLVSFSLPASTGIAEPQRIESTPARVSTDVGDPSSPNNRLVLRGTNLAIGKLHSLVLKNAVWAKQGFQTVVIDPTLNPAWKSGFRSDRIEMEIDNTLKVDAITNLVVFPGTYTASLRVVKDEKVILNQLKQISDTSNEVPFFVAPRIRSHTPPSPDKRITVEIEPEFDLTHGAGTDQELEIRVVMAGRTYERKDFDPSRPDPADNHGRFEVSANSVTLQAFDVSPGDHPFRLIVNGAESAPFWIELNP